MCLIHLIIPRPKKHKGLVDSYENVELYLFLDAEVKNVSLPFFNYSNRKYQLCLYVHK